MRLLIKNHIFPLIIVATLLSILQQIGALDTFLFGDSEILENSRKEPSDYIYSFNSDTVLENNFSSALARKSIVFFGSSELTGRLPGLPHYFFKENIGLRVISVGHAGNQTMSMVTQLLANRKYLKNSRLVILLSPGWFEAKSLFGTSLESFLEYNSERWLGKICIDLGVPHNFKVNLGNYVSRHYSHIVNPSLPLKVLHFMAQSERSFMHSLVNYPFYQFNMLRIKEQDEILYLEEVDKTKIDERIRMDEWWAEFYSAFEKEHLANSRNNNWGIDSTIYVKFYQGGKGNIWPAPNNVNQELKDLKFLCEILKYYGAAPLFVLMPLNPFYYKGIEKLNNPLGEVLGILEKNNFSYLNLFTSDTSNYEKSLLKDVMHLDNYGWCKVNEFVFRNYVVNEGYSPKE